MAMEAEAETGRRSRGVTALLWLLVAAWALFIWGMGSDDLARDQTASWLLPWLRALLPWAGERTLDAVHYAIRKTAHLSEYGLFAVLCFAAMRRSWAFSSVRTAALALIAVGVLSSADEWRQTHSSVRSGSPADVVLDLTGGAVVLGASRWMATLGRRAETRP